MKQFVFFTDEHRSAMDRIWFVVVTVVPTSLWRLRNHTIHEGKALTPDETEARIWSECTTQLRAVSAGEMEKPETRFGGICLRQCADILQYQTATTPTTRWRRARLHFDGGERGNPGPGGSSWILLVHQQQRDQWEVLKCGFKYHGPSTTNNVCEYEALRGGLAQAWTALQRNETHLEVIGDSNLIVAQQTGRARVLAEHLKESTKRVKILSSNFGWTSFKHHTRDRNTMADFLTNLAMDTKSGASIDDSARGTEAEWWRAVRGRVQQDTKESTARAVQKCAFQQGMS